MTKEDVIKHMKELNAEHKDGKWIATLSSQIIITDEILDKANLSESIKVLNDQIKYVLKPKVLSLIDKAYIK